MRVKQQDPKGSSSHRLDPHHRSSSEEDEEEMKLAEQASASEASNSSSLHHQQPSPLTTSCILVGNGDSPSPPHRSVGDRRKSTSAVSSVAASTEPQEQQKQQNRPQRHYTPQQRKQLLERAVHDVVTYGISVRLAAESHGVAKSSLSDYIRRKNIRLPSPAVKAAAAAAAAAASSGASGVGNRQSRKRHRQSLSPSATDGHGSFTRQQQQQQQHQSDLLHQEAVDAASVAPIGIGCWSLGSLPTLVPWKPPGPWGADLAAAGHTAAAAHTTMKAESGVEADVAEQQPQLMLLRGAAAGSLLLSQHSSKLAAATMAATSTDLSQQLCDFINRSPSPFHAVAESKRMLESAGFGQLREDQPWSVRPNQRAFVSRNGSTLFAFAVGGRWQPGNGFSIVGAHTDSPCLKLKPISLRDGAGDLQQCGVETYGGGLWYTWFDRDLTAAGRVIVRAPADPTTGRAARLAERLVNLEAPVFKVPSLAIHLDRTANDGFAPNRENHLAPILCRKVQEQSAGSAGSTGSTPPSQHPPALVSRVAQLISCQPEDIVDWELFLADTQPAQLTGLCREFVSSPRLDNLLSCFGALTALIEAPGLAEDTNCRVVCLYDHEEIGSQSAQGAGSELTQHFLRRLCPEAAFEQAVPRSMLVSADVAHAVHPNYEDKHERKHRPTLFGGLVVKTNSNQRYATNARTGALLRECLSRAAAAAPATASLQEFVVRQDVACGSTIGPILAAKIGLPTVDVGSPVLAMHSCRETTAAVSPGQCAQLFSAFFQHFPSLRDDMEMLE